MDYSIIFIGENSESFRWKILDLSADPPVEDAACGEADYN